MKRTIITSVLATSGLMLALTVATAGAQAAPMNEQGCCCVEIKNGKVGCGEKSQNECLAEQPKTLRFDKLPDWTKDVAESQSAEGKKLKSGWRAGKCPM